LIAAAVSCAAAAVLLLRRWVRSTAGSSQAERLTRNRVYLIAPGALVLVAGVIGFPFFYKPRSPARGSAQVGAYLVEPTLASSCAVDAHRVFFKGHVVTEVAAVVMVSPYDPSRLLYTVACANNGDESGTWYYGGGAAAPVQAHPLTLHASDPPLNTYWSPDDRYVVVPVQGKETLLNLETGRRSQYLDDVFPAPGAFSSGVHFRGWSPDGKRFAMEIGTASLNDDRSLTRTAELVSVDPETMEPTHVATRPNAWTADAFGWARVGLTYQLTVTDASGR
jgi:hypothetical protein